MPSKHVRVVARIIAKRGKEEQLGAALRSLVSTFTFVEEWMSDADFEAHAEAPHVQEAGSVLKGLVDAVPDIRRYRVMG